MIRVSIRVDGTGCLRRLEAEGHSLTGGRDFSPSCAAASALLRTAAEIISAEDGVETRVSLPDEGRMLLETGAVPAERVDRFRGITDFLACGLLRLEREDPGSLRVAIVE